VDLETFQALLAPLGQETLQAAQVLEPREEKFLQHFQVLERRFPSGLARAALEIAILRREAAQKFSQAERLYFTREALEQASSETVATYRSQRYQGFRNVLDLGCSIGADTLALASAAARGFGLDRDPLRLAMAQANAQALGLSERVGFIQTDLRGGLPVGSSGLQPGTLPALFFDPARRTAGRRLFSVEAYSPPLSTITAWLERFPALGVKISPGVNLEEIQDYPAEVEFISLQGELKEAVLWFGPFKTTPHRATVLPGPYSMEETFSEPLPVEAPKAFLYEPDPSILRAGLVAALGARLGAVQLDPDIAYLTADHQVPTPFARVWAVRDWFPFTLKRLRAYLRERGIGRVTIKKRGSPLEPERLQRDLRLEGEAQAVIFLTHLRGRPIVVIGDV
jgi:SAM-dependent methyltransferase